MILCNQLRNYLLQVNDGGIKTKWWKMSRINNKDTRMRSITTLLCLYCQVWTSFQCPPSLTLSGVFARWVLTIGVVFAWLNKVEHFQFLQLIRGETFYSLFFTRYLLLFTHYSLFFTRYSLLFTRYSLFFTC